MLFCCLDDCLLRCNSMFHSIIWLSHTVHSNSLTLTKDGICEVLLKEEVLYLVAWCLPYCCCCASSYWTLMEWTRTQNIRKWKTKVSLAFLTVSINKTTVDGVKNFSIISRVNVHQMNTQTRIFHKWIDSQLDYMAIIISQTPLQKHYRKTDKMFIKDPPISHQVRDFP